MVVVFVVVVNSSGVFVGFFILLGGFVCVIVVGFIWLFLEDHGHLCGSRMFPLSHTPSFSLSLSLPLCLLINPNTAKGSSAFAKVHFSKELLNLRKIQETLARRQDYVQAQRVKLKADALEEEEVERLRARHAAAVVNKESRIRLHQSHELDALKSRIESNRLELVRARENALKKLLQRYQNVKREMELSHGVELKRAETAISGTSQTVPPRWSVVDSMDLASKGTLYMDLEFRPPTPPPQEEEKPSVFAQTIASKAQPNGEEDSRSRATSRASRTSGAGNKGRQSVSSSRKRASSSSSSSTTPSSSSRPSSRARPSTGPSIVGDTVIRGRDLAPLPPLKGRHTRNPPTAPPGRVGGRSTTPSSPAAASSQSSPSSKATRAVRRPRRSGERHSAYPTMSAIVTRSSGES